MSRKSKIKNLPTLVPKSEIQNLNYDNQTCNLKFSKCDENKYQLWDLTKDQLKTFVFFAKKIENIDWENIKKSKGFHYETINSLTPPSNISKDVTIKSIRVNQEFRIYGYRMNADFYIIWFDPNHELT